MPTISLSSRTSPARCNLADTNSRRDIAHCLKGVSQKQSHPRSSPRRRGPIWSGLRQWVDIERRHPGRNPKCRMQLGSDGSGGSGCNRDHIESMLCRNGKRVAGAGGREGWVLWRLPFVGAQTMLGDGCDNLETLSQPQVILKFLVLQTTFKTPRAMYESMPQWWHHILTSRGSHSPS
jgi:hypothetical protein